MAFTFQSHMSCTKLGILHRTISNWASSEVQSLPPFREPVDSSPKTKVQRNWWMWRFCKLIVVILPQNNTPHDTTQIIEAVLTPILRNHSSPSPGLIASCMERRVCMRAPELGEDSKIIIASPQISPTLPNTFKGSGELCVSDPHLFPYFMDE